MFKFKTKRNKTKQEKKAKDQRKKKPEEPNKTGLNQDTTGYAVRAV
jgi:hypothetical protein